MAGPSDIYTMTPGSAVADQLQDILARKRAEARQNLLDSVGVLKTQSSIDNDALQAEALKESRDATAEWRHSQAAQEQSRQQRLAARDKAIQGFKTSPTYTGLTPEQRSAFDLAAATGDDNDSIFQTMISKMLTPERPSSVPLIVLGRDGRYHQGDVHGPIVSSTTPGSIIHEEPAPVVGPKGPTENWKAAGFGDNGVSLFTSDLKPGYFLEDKTPYHGKVHDKAQPTYAGLKIPGGVQTNLSKLYGKAAANGWMGKITGSASADIGAYKTALAIAFANIPASQDAKDTAIDIVNRQLAGQTDRNDKPLSQYTTQELIDTQRHNFPDPIEFQQFSDLLRIARQLPQQ